LQFDERFAGRSQQIDNYDQLATNARDVFVTKDRADWLVDLDRHDVPFAPVYDVTEVADDTQVRHLGSFFEVENPVQGRLSAIRRPIWLDGQRDDRPRSLHDFP
jgi:crotonobetainyl-CoA:carnitine CoA-transferase CaiB-like acyl-CoA transferase